MRLVKRCELCVKVLDCEIHNKIRDNLEFLREFLDIKETEEIAKYCKFFMTKKDLKYMRKI